MSKRVDWERDDYCEACKWPGVAHALREAAQQAMVILVALDMAVTWELAEPIKNDIRITVKQLVAALATTKARSDENT